MEYVCNFHDYRLQYEYYFKYELQFNLEFKYEYESDCEFKSKSNLENILLAINKK